MNPAGWTKGRSCVIMVFIDRRGAKGLRYALRLIWVIVKILALSFLILGLVGVCFFTARDTAHVWVIVNDGLKARANAVMGISEDGENGQLGAYFTGGFLANDSFIRESPYASYVIRDFDYKLSVKSIWCSPWQGRATVEVVESVTGIDGVLSAAQGDAANSPPPPVWQRARYRLVCVLIDGRWYIDSMEPVELLEPEPTPTDEPVLTPSPTPKVAATPSPTPTPLVTATPAGQTRWGIVNVTDPNTLNLRAGPGTDYDILGVMANGTRVEILDREGSWFRIRVGSLEGWAYTRYIDEEAPAN